MFKKAKKGVGTHLFLKILKRTMPIWLLPLLVIFLVTSTIDTITNFFKNTNENSEFQPITKEAVTDYIKYESSSVLRDEIAYENVYSKKIHTSNFSEDYLNENEISNMFSSYQNEVTLYKRNATWPYRSYYELLSAMEIVSETKNIQKISWNENFKSKFQFTDNDAKHFVNEFIVIETFTDGRKTHDKRYQVNYVYIRPVAQLKSVSTIFYDIIFRYKKETINETDWNISKNVKHSIINRKGEKIKQKIVTTTYTKTKDEVYVLKEKNKQKNYRIENFIKKNLKGKMLLTDLVYVYEYGRSFEGSHEFESVILEYLSPESSYAIGDLYLKESSMIDYVGGDMHWPTLGYKRITSPFGYRTHPISGKRKLHTGIDIAIPYGEPILAAQDGEVIYSGLMGGYGYVIVIDHGGGISTLYAHNSDLFVDVGDKVLKGEKIAACGSTGVSTGAHLHFEVRDNGKYKNPFEYIRKENR